MKTIQRPRLAKAPPLEWSRAPSRSRDLVLGLRKRWSTRCRTFAIDQFPEATGRFIALSRLPDAPQTIIRKMGTGLPAHALGDFATLAQARRACQKALQEATG